MKPTLLLFCLTAIGSASQIVLQWNPPTQPVAEHRVYRLEGDKRTLVWRGAGVESGAIQHTTEAKYVVTAVNGGVESDPSAPLDVPTAPIAPSGVKVKVIVEIITP